VKPVLVVPALAAALTAITPASAATLRDMMFPGNASCYLRQYSDAHLAGHPDQLVAQIALGPTPGNTYEPGWIVLTVTVRLRGSQETYMGGAICDLAGDRLDCAMEGDAGAFTLTRAKDGGVMLNVSPRGMAFEGEQDFIEISGTSGDDRAFLMPRVTADFCP
jgi:hypothetical protein